MKTIHRLVAIASAIALAAWLAPACDSGDGGLPVICAPNKTETCPCGGGTEGIQSCNEQGTGYNECDCSLAGGVVDDTGDDTGDVVDTPVDDTGDETGDACTPTNVYHEKGCQGSDVLWFDDCGASSEFVKTCNGDLPICSEGDCIQDTSDTTDCVPHSLQSCDNGDLFWFDSCGGKESVAEICADSEFCYNAACNKGIFNGQWYVTEDPNAGGGGGLLGGTFVPNTFTLSVVDDVATFTEPVLGQTVSYVGTLEGKTLIATGSYSASGADHDIQIQVTFEADHDVVGIPAPHRFTGVYVDSFSFEGTPLGAQPYNILGVKQ